jgi:hypothetical protein
MAAQLGDVLYAERMGIGGKITVQEIVSFASGGNPIIYTAIDFGTMPINEDLFNVVDSLCTTTSKIEISQYFISQKEENFGVILDLFTECFNGNFNIIAVSKEPFSRGIFNIKYRIL